MYDNTDNFEFGDDFLDMTPKAHTMKEIIDKLHFIKTSSGLTMVLHFRALCLSLCITMQ